MYTIYSKCVKCRKLFETILIFIFQMIEHVIFLFERGVLKLHAGQSALQILNRGIGFGWNAVTVHRLWPWLWLWL